MISNIEQIELQMLAEYERSGALDVAAWTRRHPEHRDAILHYWLWLRGTPSVEELTGAPPPVIEDDIAEDALEQATLAANLGSAWLEEVVDGAEGDEDPLGTELDELRRRAFSRGGTASPEFRRAAVYAWVVAEWTSDTATVTRLRAQKATYFLEHGLALGLFTEHRRKPLGPYDHKARYRDAEPIAKRQKWLAVSGTVLKPGPKIEAVQKYAPRYLRREDLARRLLNVLEPLSDAELETWATVHSAVHALSGAGGNPTPDRIREWLEEIPEWKGKLRRVNFSTEALQAALQNLARLRFVQL